MLHIRCLGRLNDEMGLYAPIDERQHFFPFELRTIYDIGIVAEMLPRMVSLSGETVNVL